MKTDSVFISAGDISGDIHAARLAAALKMLRPGLRLSALGGDRLQSAADEFIAHLTKLNGFGFFAPVRLYLHLRKVLNVVRRSWDVRPPDRVVLVDYYGFNIHLAREARRRGIPVYYYISPQVWASRPGRVAKIARAVTRMLVILPFEQKIYRDAGVAVDFVGHPLIDEVPLPEGSSESCVDHPVIGFFPGSRPNVCRRHLPILEQAARRIREEIPMARCVLFAVPGQEDLLKGTTLPIVTETDFSERQHLCLAVTTSGTVTLENALLGIPMVVMYRLSWFNYLLARLLVNIRYITMVNILAGRMIVPELIQSDASAGAIAREAVQMLRNPSLLRETRERLIEFRQTLGTSGVSERAARIILNEQQ